MKGQFNKESLEKLGIFELRNLAREIGVYSPTIYKKEVLIEKILLIINGKEEPYVSKTKQGRPPKSISSINNIIDIFIPKSNAEEKEKSYNTLSYDINLLARLTAMDSNQLQNQYQTYENKKVSAILEVFEEGYGFCYEKGYRTNNLELNYFVSESIISSYHLRTGDILEGFVKKVVEDKPYLLYKLEKINGTSIAEFNLNRPDFNELLAQYPSERILFSNNTENAVTHWYMQKYLPIGKGQRILLATNKENDFAPLISLFLNIADNQNKTSKKCLLIDERPEDITEYKKLLKDTKLVCTNVDDNPYEAIQKIELSIEHAKRKVELNEDVIVVISNLVRLQNLYKKKFTMSKAHEIEDDFLSITMIKKLFASARNTQGSGTLTIVGLIDRSSNETLYNSLKELSNMYLLLDEKRYDKKEKIWFDILKSETRKSELLLNEKDYKNLLELKDRLNIENKEQITSELENAILKGYN